MSVKTPDQIRKEFWADKQNLVNKALADPAMIARALREVEQSVVWANGNFAEIVSLERALIDQYLKAIGLKFRSGRKLGTTGPIRKAIARELQKHPDMKNAQLWKALAAKPPKGWTFFDNHLGKYIEGPKGGQEMSYRTFLNAAALERRPQKA